MTTRREILEMLSAGELDVERATEMLNVLGRGEEPVLLAEPGLPDEPATPVEEPAAVARSASKRSGPRMLRIHVSDLQSGRHRVRVNVPLGLVNIGLKIGARFTDEFDDDTVREVIDALHDPEISGTIVEVEDEDDNERVHIFID
jgi:hypothetical protein